MVCNDGWAEQLWLAAVAPMDSLTGYTYRTTQNNDGFVLEG